MRKVTVSGLYRYDLPGATEQGIKEYSVTFDANSKTDSPGVCIKNAAIILKKQDPAFDSLKTHLVTWAEVEPVEETKNVEPSGSPIEPAGKDSGAELFE